MFTHEKEFLENRKLSRIAELKTKKVQCELKSHNKDINMVVYDPDDDCYIIGMKSGRLYKAPSLKTTTELKSLIGTNENDTNLEETTFNKYIHYMGEENLKKTFKHRFGFVWIGEDACYGVLPNKIFDIGHGIDLIKEIKLYEIHAWGDKWWDKRFMACGYQGGVASPAPVFPNVDHLVPHFTHWCKYTTLVAGTEGSNPFMPTGIDTRGNNINSYNNTHNVIPFINRNIPFDVFNSHNIMKVFKNRNDIEIISAYDNGEMVRFAVANYDPTNVDLALQEVDVTALYWKSSRNDRIIYREFVRTNVPRYETTYPSLDSYNFKPFGNKAGMKYPGVLIDDVFKKFNIGMNLISMNAQRTGKARYGTEFTVMDIRDGATVSAGTRKYITNMPKKADFQSYHGDDMTTVTNTFLSEWNSVNADNKFPNYNNSPVFIYEKDVAELVSDEAFKMGRR